MCGLSSGCGVEPPGGAVEPDVGDGVDCWPALGFGVAARDGGCGMDTGDAGMSGDWRDAGCRGGGRGGGGGWWWWW